MSSENTIYCIKCGTKNNINNNYCIKCGTKLIKNISENSKVNLNKNEIFLDTATKKINKWTGEDKAIKLDIPNLFSQVLKKHSKQEADEIFIVGTNKTTPSLKEISEQPVTPWVYSRVLLVMLSVVALLWIVKYVFGNNIVSMSLIFFSGFTVPITLLIFFFETNAFKNISIFETFKMFLIGGALSLISTMFLYEIIDTNNFSFIGAILIGIIEETGKLLIVIYYINKNNYSHIFNGMLVGAAVGAGFAAFENVGYVGATNLTVAVLRSFTSIGGHAIWTAILGAAIVIIKKDNLFTWNMLFNNRFIRFYLLVVIMHGLWDADIHFESIKIISLIVVGWIVILVLIHAGLREIKQIHKNISIEEANEKV